MNQRAALRQSTASEHLEPGLNDSLMEEEDAGSAAQQKNSENAVMKTNVCLMSPLLCMRFKHLKCQTAAAGMFSQMLALPRR